MRTIPKVESLDIEFKSDLKCYPDHDLIEYYGIIDNSVMNKKFRYNVLKSLFYWLNRRRQKKSYTWERFLHMIDEAYPLVKPKVYVNLFGIYAVNN